MNEQKLEYALAECLERMEAETDLEECLSRYPGDTAAELRTLLQTAMAARTELAAATPPASGRVRARVMAAWNGRIPAPQKRLLRLPWRWSWPMFFPRWAAAAAAVLIVVFSGGAGTIVASTNAVPGDALYPVKETHERTQLWLTRSPEDKVAAYTTLVRERVQELETLAAAGRYESNAIAVDRLGNHVTEINALLGSSGVSDAARLEEVAAAKTEAGDVLLAVIGQVPAEARPAIEEALALIDAARSRVDTAIEELRRSSPETREPGS